MDKENLVQEKYLDAAAELFMEQYAAVLEETICMDAQWCQEEFPAELDQRCQKLIREQKKQQRQHIRRKNILRGLRKVAVVILVFVCAFTLLFYNVEAVRVPIMNFLIERFDAYWEITYIPPDDLSKEFDPDDPLKTILPEDFQLINNDNYWENGVLVADYANAENQHVNFSTIPIDGTTILDTEDAEVTTFSLNGNEAIMAVEGDIVRIFWVDMEAEISCTLITAYIDSEKALYFANCITELF